MAGGINRIGPSLGAGQIHRAAAKDEREREEQADFAELVEHATPHPERSEEQEQEQQGPVLDTGYPTDDETGTSLDLSA